MPFQENSFGLWGLANLCRLSGDESLSSLTLQPSFRVLTTDLQANFWPSSFEVSSPLVQPTRKIKWKLPPFHQPLTGFFILTATSHSRVARLCFIPGSLMGFFLQSFSLTGGVDSSQSLSSLVVRAFFDKILKTTSVLYGADSGQRFHPLANSANLIPKAEKPIH